MAAVCAWTSRGSDPFRSFNEGGWGRVSQARQKASHQKAVVRGLALSAKARERRETDMRRKLEGGMTLQEIADTYGISRERVRQITVGSKRPKRNGGPCEAKDCDRVATHAGLCSTHYYRVSRNGSTELLDRRVTCPRCGGKWYMRDYRCPGCGVSRYAAFPKYRIAPSAQSKALTELTHLRWGEYRRLYIRAKRRHEPHAAQQQAQKALAHAHPVLYRRLYLAFVEEAAR